MRQRLLGLLVLRDVTAHYDHTVYIVASSYRAHVGRVPAGLPVRARHRHLERAGFPGLEDTVQLQTEIRSMLRGNPLCKEGAYNVILRYSFVGPVGEEDCPAPIELYHEIGSVLRE